MKNVIAVLAVAGAAGVAAAQPVSTSAGTNPTSYSGLSAGATNEVQWWSFSLTQTVGPGSGRFLILDTWNNTFTGGTFGTGDSELGLYDGAGARIGNWDDTGGMVPRERVLFGDAALATAAGFVGFTTQTTVLNPGTYYAASAPYNVTFNATGWSATVAVSGPAVGNAGFQAFSNIPAPGAVALLGLGGLVAARRRR